MAVCKAGLTTVQSAHATLRTWGCTFTGSEASRRAACSYVDETVVKALDRNHARTCTIPPFIALPTDTWTTCSTNPNADINSVNTALMRISPSNNSVD